MYKCLDKYSPQHVVLQNEGLQPRISFDEITRLMKCAVTKALKEKEVGADELNS